MERKYGISTRWKTSDDQYVEVKMHLLSEKKLRVRNALWSSIVKRHYLLCMKAEYAGMYYENDQVFCFIDIVLFCRWTKDSEKTVFKYLQGNESCTTTAGRIQCCC